jgi:hypothetical protein
VGPQVVFFTNAIKEKKWYAYEMKKNI